jgi:radical SAM superfamily enzyme YgiQ (UPF0313 family)
MSKLFIVQVPEELNLLYNEKNTPPLGIALLKGYLIKKNHVVDLSDLTKRFQNLIEDNKKQKILSFYDKELLKRYLEKDEIHPQYEQWFEELLKDDLSTYDAIGISCGSSQSIFEIHFSFILAKYIQQKYNKIILFGGTNMTYLYLFKNVFFELWKLAFKHFQYFFYGPGELPLEEFISNIDSPDLYNIHKKLPGAIYLKNGEVYANPECLPAFVCPDFDSLNLDDYTTCIRKNTDDINYQYSWPYPWGIYLSNKNKRELKDEDKQTVTFIPYVFNFYCPYQCAFCEQSNEQKKRPCSKDIDTIIADIRHLSKKYDSNCFIFFNNTVNFNKKFIIDFCNRLIKDKVNILWSDCARANGLDKDIIKLMYNAGCRKLIFGFESGSERILKYINKKLDIRHLENVLKWCTDVSIAAEIEVIVGFPHESYEDFKATYNFIDKNMKNISYFHVNKFFVVPSSLFGCYPERYGIDIFNNFNYEELIERSIRVVNNVRNMEENGINNFHIIKFEEINGRKWSEIIKETSRYYLTLNKIQRSMPIIEESKRVFSEY